MKSTFNATKRLTEHSFLLKNHHIIFALVLSLAAINLAEPKAEPSITVASPYVTVASPSGFAVPAIANSVLDPATQEVLSITQSTLPQVAQSLATIAANGARDGPFLCDACHDILTIYGRH